MNLNALFGLAALVTMLFSISKLTVASQVESRTLRSLEILRPLIGEVSYIQSRADFYSMSSKRDFVALKARLDEQAQHYRISIPIDDHP